MFISNTSETMYNQIFDSDSDIIEYVEKTFCNDINELLKNKFDLSKWIDKLKSNIDMKISVAKFNYHGLRYFS